jgi:ABC-type transport system substrate-binding protein
VLPLSTTASAQGEQTITIVGDQWKTIGLDVELSTLGATQARDLRLRASFPGFWLAGYDISWDGQLRRVSGRDCPTEASRWVGGSLGCYQNAEMDGIIDRIAVETDRGEQRRLWRDLVRIQSEDLPVLPLFFSVFVTLFRDGVTGVRGPSKPSTRATWNAAEWDLTS